MVNFKLDSLTFEGPLDLLLHLIQKNKVSVYDIPIAEITAQYMEYVSVMSKLDMEGAGDFLVMAAHLLLIKSKMLLPGSEKEDDGIDPRSELVDRLVEYAKYKESATYFGENQYADKFVFYKEPDEIKLPTERLQNTQIPLSRLLRAFEDVMERRREKDEFVIKKEALETIVKRETVPVKNRIYHIYRRFLNKKDISFDGLFDDVKSRAEAVSTFLAVLELMRRGRMLIAENDGALICRLSDEKLADEEIERIEAEN